MLKGFKIKMQIHSLILSSFFLEIALASDAIIGSVLVWFLSICYTTGNILSIFCSILHIGVILWFDEYGYSHFHSTGENIFIEVCVIEGSNMKPISPINANKGCI